MRLTKSILLLTVLTALALPTPVRAQESLSPMVVQALIHNGGTSLQLQSGKIYFYGFVTGGALPTSQFANGQYVKAVDAAGQLAAALAYGSNSGNGYDTQTGYHAIGGFSVAGFWDSFDAFSGSNQESGASSATVNFRVPYDSLVLVIALASSQQSISLEGVPGLQVDAINHGEGTEAMMIGHAYLPSGAYSAREISAATAAGQDPAHMVDLIGIFVLGSKKGLSGASIRPSTPTPPSGRPRIIKAIIEQGQNSLQLPTGDMYIYGMDTGGALPSSGFENDGYAQVTDVAGNIAAAIAYGTDDQNFYNTQTWAHTIGGVSVTGSWDDFKAFYGGNSQVGASNASADFIVVEDSLVVIIALTGGQTSLSLQPIPGLQIDASNSGGPGKIPMIIAHTYLKPGTYTAAERTSGTSDLDRHCMSDLIGVFVFGSRR